MLSKTKIRFCISLLLLFFFLIWFYVSKGVLGDYIDLLSHATVVQVSVITLWLPVGFLGVLLCMLWMSPKALWKGKKINQIYSPKAIQRANNISIYFALAGIAFAVGWTYHSLDLLDRYGYVYSSALTKFTPTGIHLIYVLPK
ncbi:hypothetical protein [Bizionia sp.]|uniref:hypothetical protein n=1 Tax=Bizionia sp. TaxID=1954480 RepID=UPI003A934FC4